MRTFALLFLQNKKKKSIEISKFEKKKKSEKKKKPVRENKMK
jgi:hypothetical protein